MRNSAVKPSEATPSAEGRGFLQFWACHLDPAAVLNALPGQLNASLGLVL